MPRSAAALPARDSSIQKLIAEGDEKTVVRAAGDRADRLGIAAVLGAEGLERVGDAFRPVGRAVGEDIGPAARLHEHAGIQKRKEIDNGGMLRQDSRAGSRRHARRTPASAPEHGEPAKGEGGVVKVRIAFAPGDAAIRVLRRAQIEGVPGSGLLRQACQPFRKLGGEPPKIRLRRHPVTSCCETRPPSPGRCARAAPCPSGCRGPCRERSRPRHRCRACVSDSFKSAVAPSR